MEINLENVKLETFDKTKLEHVKILEKFPCNKSKDFVYDIRERLQQNCGKKFFPFQTAYFIVSMGNIIGYFYISRIQNDDASLEYFLLEEYRGKRYGSLCLGEVSEYLFNHYNIRKLIVDVDTSNLASISCALSCGFYPDEDDYLERNMQGRMQYYLDNYNYMNKRKR